MERTFQLHLSTRYEKVLIFLLHPVLFSAEYLKSHKSMLDI